MEDRLCGRIQEAEAKMNSLKTWIRSNDFKVTEKWVPYIGFVSTLSVYVFIFALLHILLVTPVNGVGWWMESPIWKAWRTLGRRRWRISGKPYSRSLWRSDDNQSPWKELFSYVTLFGGHSVVIRNINKAIKR